MIKIILTPFKLFLRRRELKAVTETATGWARLAIIRQNKQLDEYRKGESDGRLPDDVDFEAIACDAVNLHRVIKENVLK